MRRESEEHRVNRLKVYESYLSSGLGVTAYSREHGISPWKLRGIIERSERESSPFGSFQEVKIPKVADAMYGIVLGNGRELQVRRGFSAEEVKKLVETLERC